jgi:hypothetical protein
MSGAAGDDAARATPPAQFDFDVTETTKDKTHPHYGEGSKLGFVVNGVQGKSLVVVRGKTYKFWVHTNPMHDFYLTLEPMGWGTGTLTDGVKGNFTYRGVITFTPSATTPDTVYYGCRNHQYMGGEIHVVNPGDEGKVKLNEPAVMAESVKKELPQLDRNEISQRLNFATVFIFNSDAAKRISDGNNTEAKAKYADALDKISKATEAYNADDLQEAKSRGEDAMVSMTAAAKLVPSEAMQQRTKAKNEDLIVGVMSLEASYKKNREDMLKQGGAKNSPPLDSDRIHQRIDDARALSDAGKLEDANKILTDLMGEISSALNGLLANSTMSYEMKFKTPGEEYAYELQHYASLENALPLAVEQKQPSPQALKLMQTYVDKGKEKRDQAAAAAKQGDMVDALENIKNGIQQLETSLRLIGVF